MPTMTESHLARKPVSRPQRVSSWLAHAFAFLSLVLVCRYAGGTDTSVGYLGGFNWSDLTFNWHPVMMVGGLLIVATEGMLAYRTWTLGHAKNKQIHALFQSVGLFMVILGLVAVFLSHNSEKHGGYKPNLYTAHGWVGIFVVTLYFFQYVAGVSAFVVPAMRAKIAAAWLPLHRFLGLFTYFGALVAAGMGIAEKTGFNAAPAEYDTPDINPMSHYHLLPGGYRVAFGLMISLLFTVLFATFATMDFPDGTHGANGAGSSHSNTYGATDADEVESVRLA